MLVSFFVLSFFFKVDSQFEQMLISYLTRIYTQNPHIWKDRQVDAFRN